LFYIDLGLKPERIIQVCVTAKEDEIDAEKKKKPE
jgi:hypothetical protein